MKKIIMLLFLLFSLVSCSMVVPNSNEKVETEEILNNEIPDISNIEFNDLTVTYDGNPHSIFVENLPTDLTVSYEGNGKTIVGVYQVKAIIKYSSGETLASLTATLTIVENTKTDIVTPTNSYTITFDNMGHGINPDALIDLEEIPNNLPELEDDLYEFFGWYLNEDLTDLAVGGTKLNANITLYAKWDEKNNDPVEKFNIVDPIFETRKIYNISDVTMDDFFNLGNRIEVKITVSDEELSKLQTDYETGHKSDIYRLASKVVIKLTNYNNTFTWEFENVGIRQKGNTSRKSIYNGDGSLNLNHYKLSFDETFDDPERYDSKFINKYGNEEYKDREFLGMSGLDFKWNKNEDSTHIREIYASYMYRASGILSQHIGLSTLSIIESNKSNKETSMGLCTVFEPASKSFIKRSLKSDDSYVNMSDWSEEKLGEYGLEGKSYGDLYKCIYGADLTNNSLYNGSIGVGNISGSYVPLYDRKTHKDDEYDDAVLKAAINAISSGDYDRISQYVDLEYLAISEAVGFVVGNPDSMRYNDNNFMIYMRRTDGKMVFIPIDNDRCFGITKDWNPKDANMNLSMLDRKDSTGDNTIKLLLDTVLAKTSNPTQELYVEFCNKLKESLWCDYETFKTYYNMAKSSYGSDYYFSSSDSSVNVTFERYMNNKLKNITINNNDDNNNNDNNVTVSSNIYFVSSINDWGNYSENELSKYRLQLISENTYQITVTVTSVLRDNGTNYIKFKFNNGFADYSKIDWTLSDDLKTLNTSVGSSAKVYGVNVGDTLLITINVKTKEASVVINGN